MTRIILASAIFCVLAGCATPTARAPEAKKLSELSCAELTNKLAMSKKAYHDVKKANEARMKKRSLAGDVGFILGAALGGMNPEIARQSLESNYASGFKTAPLNIDGMLTYTRERKRRC